MAHPLNRPRYDERQADASPVATASCSRASARSLSGAQRSRFAQLFGGEPGIDPYTRAVSDVYQDLFGEGSFIGKGIYDVDAFERALDGRFPENRILSHDLLEGCYARSGLLSDVHLYEDYPARYEADMSRRQRWIRGDWQIAHWLLPRVPGPGRHGLPNPLSALSRWKILDNLRRSLVPAALLLLFLFGWIGSPHAVYWTLAVAGVVLIPPLSIGIVTVLRRRESTLLSRHLSDAMRSIGRSLAQAAFRIACLPHEATVSAAAVLRTGVRMLVTRRHLLEWSAYDDRQVAPDLPGSIRSMWSTLFFAGLTAAGLALWRLAALPAALPVLVLWLAAPLLTWWLSRPLQRRAAELTRRTGGFPAPHRAQDLAPTSSGSSVEDDHWLPPDNFQEQPGPVIAHRTSPTNIGMALLANLAASDFGYISARRPD